MEHSRCDASRCDTAANELWRRAILTARDTQAASLSTDSEMFNASLRLARLISLTVRREPAISGANKTPHSADEPPEAAERFVDKTLRRGSRSVRRNTVFSLSMEHVANKKKKNKCPFGFVTARRLASSYARRQWEFGGVWESPLRATQSAGV